MTENTPRAARGRPRSDRARQAVLDAAADILMECGMAGFTMEAVAARARVSKATLYKWWPSRSAVATDGFFARVGEPAAVPDAASTGQALLFQVDALRVLLTETPSGALMRSLIGHAQTDPDIGAALRERWLAPRRAVAERILRAGIASGQVRADIDVAVTMDQLFAPLYYRLLLGHEPLTVEVVRYLVDQVMAAIAAGPAPGSSSR